MGGNIAISPFHTGQDKVPSSLTTLQTGSVVCDDFGWYSFFL